MLVQFSIIVRNHLDIVYPNLWIGRGSTEHCPARLYLGFSYKTKEMKNLFEIIQNNGFTLTFNILMYNVSIYINVLYISFIYFKII